MRQYIDGKTLDRSKMIVDFESVVKSNSLSSGRPFWLTSDKIDVSKTVAARSKYSEAFAKAAVNSSTPLESLKVMSKILELNQNGKSIFVYNNGGRTCSHNNGLTINLTNTTVDGISYGTIYHETGHFLFDNVLGGKLPTDFVATRQGALKNLYSAQNADLLKTVRKNLYEINMYSDYKANSTLTSSLQKKGFANIDAYKKYLVEQYSSQTVSERASTLLDRTKNQGVMLQNSFEREYTNNFDFDSALKCANLEISSMQLKAKDSIARSLGGYTKISGMIDSLTMSRDKIWYGHSREYFESKPNSNLFAYHELIADYTDLRVSGNSKMIGFMRQLFGNEMMDMLENTYQDMLK